MSEEKKQKPKEYQKECPEIKKSKHNSYNLIVYNE